MKSKTSLTKKDIFVVSGCVVFLLANLGAVGSGGRRRAKETLCLANLLRWGRVFARYTEDNDGLFPDQLGLSRPYLKQYYRRDKLLLCPQATKNYEEGGQNPFAAHSYYGGVSSYGHNAWICSKPVAQFQTDEKMWKTINVSGGQDIPMVFDCAAYQNASPWHRDEPPLFDGEFIPGTSHDEMRLVCLNRHNAAVNGVFLDLSARKIGLKELWELQWHRNWNPDNNPPPAWPTWMQNFKDY